MAAIARGDPDFVGTLRLGSACRLRWAATIRPTGGEAYRRKVLIEAAACARPIVAQDVRGCREVVRHGENGWLVPPEDPKAIVEALCVLIQDPDLRAPMGQCGRQIAESDFSVEKVVREKLAVYGELLST